MVSSNSTSSTKGSVRFCTNLRKTQEQFDNSVLLRGSFQLYAPIATLPIFILDTSRDRRACAVGGAVVQKPPVLTSAPAMDRFRRWFRCPPLCQWAVLELAQLRVPAPRESGTWSHPSDWTPPSASGTRSQISDKNSLSVAAGRLEEGPEIEHSRQCSLRGTSCGDR